MSGSKSKYDPGAHHRRIGEANARDLLYVIRGFVLQRGYAPSCKQMVELTGWNEHKVIKYFRRLCKQGEITRYENGLRNNWNVFAKLEGSGE